MRRRETPPAGSFGGLHGLSRQGTSACRPPDVAAPIRARWEGGPEALLRQVRTRRPSTCPPKGVRAAKEATLARKRFGWPVHGAGSTPFDSGPLPAAGWPESNGAPDRIRTYDL